MSVELQDQLMRIAQPQKQLIITIPVMRRCNLNCKMCSVYSPVANDDGLDVKQLTSDLARLSQLFGETISINLSGGEPLLHGELITIMKMARNYFPTCRIQVHSNGLRLLQENSDNDDFYKACRDYNIILVITKYSIRFDIEKIIRTADRFLVEVITFVDIGKIETTGCDASIKKLNCIPLAASGNAEPYEFLACYQINRCTVLQNGKIYQCGPPAYAADLNKKFNLKFEITPSDYIDIYRVDSGDEILEKITRRIPFCKYCKFSS
jgi:MoaA/NifB/PqqE/SkfB family radical SAM enzyme